MTVRAAFHPVLICGLAVAGCGGATPSGTDPGTGTKVRITIEQQTTTPTIWAGTVWHRSGTTLGSITNFTPQSDKCVSSAVPHTCYFDVLVGDSVVLAAQDLLADVSIGNWASTTSPDDPRTIESQFTGWGTGCTVVQRGYCVLKASANVTIAAQYKPLTLTKFYFSGLNSWGLTVNAPATLDPAGISPGGPQRVLRAYGADVFIIGNPPQHPHCIGEAPGVRCAFVLTADNSTIKFEAFSKFLLTPPLGSPGPLEFVGWSGGGCSGAPVPDATSSCTLPGGVDQSVTVRWQYYRCFAANGVSSASEGTSGWKLPTSALNGCILTQ